MNRKIIILGAGTAGLISALCLREKYPLTEITIVKSKEIGIVGVGEGSTEHWDTFIRFVGIDHTELITKTDATVKIGILFKNWTTHRREYVHSVGAHIISELGRQETFNQLLVNSQNLFPLSPLFEHVYYKNNVTLNGNLRPSNQYHFDTFKLNDFLVSKCIERGITFIEGIVCDAEVDQAGYITNIKLESGISLSAELFIDCSGLKRFLSSKVGCNWVSYSKHLPMNHAIAFPTNFDDPNDIEPYTTSTALKSGWVWKIPTQTRYGNGYVYCDSYTTADNALHEMSEHLGKNIEKVARDIKFDAGRVDYFWKNNVINIGLSGSFAEPLEAQSIGFTIIQSMALLEHLDLWYQNKSAADDYNSAMAASFDNIVDYLQLHYLGDRNDSDFWNQRPFSLTSFNNQYLEVFKQGHIEPVIFQKYSNYLMFKMANWYQVLEGLGLVNKDAVIASLMKNRDAYNASHANKTQSHVEEIESRTFVINHRDYLNLIKHNYFFKNENRI